MYRPVYLLALLGCLIFLTDSVWAQDAALVKVGEEAFVAQKCLVCHSVAGKGNKNGSLDDVGARLTPDEIREWIQNGPEMMEKTNAQRKPPMRAYPNLDKGDLDGLVAYLQTLKGE